MLLWSGHAWNDGRVSGGRTADSAGEQELAEQILGENFLGEHHEHGGGVRAGNAQSSSHRLMIPSGRANQRQAGRVSVQEVFSAHRADFAGTEEACKLDAVEK